MLSGHRRTPWVVRFHPRNPSLLASGSLDHEVRLWDASSGRCLLRHTFGKPIASLAFHAAEPILAIACGHKLYMWEYRNPNTSPTIVLRTRRSMRAVHFHPHGIPLVLTAEVQDPSPTNDLKETLTEQGSFGAKNMDCSVGKDSDMLGKVTEVDNSSCLQASQYVFAETMQDSSDLPAGRSMYDLSTPIPSGNVSGNLEHSWNETGLLPRALVSVGWEVPFPMALPSGHAEDANVFGPNFETAYNASVWNILGEEQPPRVRLRLFQFDPSKPAAELNEEEGVKLCISDAVLCSEMGVHFSRCGRFLAATVACRAPMPGKAHDAAAAAVAAAGGALAVAQDAESSRNFSDTEMASGEAMDWIPSESSALPALRSERVVFEVRIFGIEKPGLGRTVKALRIRAAHCLTSVQFSPCGSHLLMAYGKKHSSLLRSLVVAQEGALIPLHTILEVVRLADMEIVGVLPSSEDEINAACFHPSPGGGIAYGTKEGRLRILVRRIETQEDYGDGVQERSSGNMRPPLSAPLLQQLRDLGNLMATNQFSHRLRSVQDTYTRPEER